MSSSTGFLSKVQDNIVKHAPTILAVFGGIGVVASVCLASKAAVDSKENIEEAREKHREEVDDPEADISFGDKAVIYAKAYWPTAVMVAATEACIYGSNHINNKRLAALGAAYILKEADFKEYKQKVEEIVGGKKAQEIKDNIMQQHVNETDTSNVVQSNNINIPKGLKMDLWWDEVSKRYFYSNIDYVRRAEIKANAQLQTDGFVSVNDIYEWLGIETVPLMENDGWDLEKHGEVVLKVGSAIKEPDMNVWTLDMEVLPKNEWLGIG